MVIFSLIFAFNLQLVLAARVTLSKTRPSRNRYRIDERTVFGLSLCKWRQN